MKTASCLAAAVVGAAGVWAGCDGAASAVVVGPAMAVLLAAGNAVQVARAEEEVEVTDEEPAAAGQQEGQPDPAELEKLQQLFSKLSDGCREEMQAAYTEGKDVSSECKHEIQSVLVPPGQGAGAGGSSNEEPGSEADKPDPRGTILGFVVLLFLGLVAWGVYAQQNIINKLPDSSAKKKLSKQKQLKERIKAQRAGATM